MLVLWLLQLHVDVSFEADYLSVVDIRKYTHNFYMVILLFIKFLM
jgi:hypothetical protein